MLATIEAELREGRIVPLELDQLPQSGKLLLTILSERKIKPDWNTVRRLLGWLKIDVDIVQWQKEIRDDWESRR